MTNTDEVYTPDVLAHEQESAILRDEQRDAALLADAENDYREV